MPKSNTTGFFIPNSTQVPDALFDVWLAELGNAELRVLLYIIRRTFGFKKGRDRISYSQFQHGITTKDGKVLDRGCGVKSPTNLRKALDSLEARGLIVAHKQGELGEERQTTEYTLQLADEVLTEQEYPPGVESGPILTQRQRQETGYKRQPNKRNGSHTNEDYLPWAEGTGAAAVGGLGYADD